MGIVDNVLLSAACTIAAALLWVIWVPAGLKIKIPWVGTMHIKKIERER